MAQPSVVNFFHTKKRSAVEDSKIVRPNKVLVLDTKVDKELSEKNGLNRIKTIVFSPNNTKKLEESTKKTPVAFKRKPKKMRETLQSNTIDKLINDMVQRDKVLECEKTVVVDHKEKHVETSTVISENLKNIITPTTPTKKSTNALDKIRITGKEPTLNELKQKLSRCSRLAELKNSISRFKKLENELEKCEEKASASSTKSPTIGLFKNIELEVELSPRKLLCPDKAYLSPKKESSVKKSLLNLLSPTKNAVAISSTSKQLFPETPKVSLTLPFKYRSLAEMFRSIDTVCQILYNRKEVITFRKLKPAVEELSKKNLTEKHIAQIKSIYSEAFQLQQQKFKVYAGAQKEQWELVIIPQIDQEAMTSDTLLLRRRKFYNILIEKLKIYHNEFLMNLDPPMVIDMDKITRWHPEFDIEKVPDIEPFSLPQPPTEVKYTTGKEVLEKAKIMFNCNSRMEQALMKLKEAQAKNVQVVEEKPKEIESILKGIPKALLEKVRQKQAAKTLVSLTRSIDKEKEVLLYSRLPEIARLTRNLFVSEKKSVLPLDVVMEKLGNSYRSHLTKSDMELHLKTISREVPDWLVFHEMRHTVFLKLLKNADVSLVIHKLEAIAKAKQES